MSFKTALTDRYGLGIAVGMVIIPGIYFLLDTLRLKIGNAAGIIDFLPAPRIHLFTIAIVMIVFRLLMVNYGREKTGKGLLSVLFLVV
ncbi:MAG: hypothetical protein RIQ47_38, partial [Bacteroidota bacterium]